MHEPSALWPAFAGSLTIDLHSLGASYLDEQPAGLREGLQEARVGALPDREDNAGTKKGEAISLLSLVVRHFRRKHVSQPRAPMLIGSKSVHDVPDVFEPFLILGEQEDSMCSRISKICGTSTTFALLPRGWSAPPVLGDSPATDGTRAGSDGGRRTHRVVLLLLACWRHVQVASATAEAQSADGQCCSLVRSAAAADSTIPSHATPRSLRDPHSQFRCSQVFLSANERRSRRRCARHHR